MMSVSGVVVRTNVMSFCGVEVWKFCGLKKFTFTGLSHHDTLDIVRRRGGKYDFEVVRGMKVVQTGSIWLW